MVLENPYVSKIKTLEDVKLLSPWGEASLDILNKEMNFDSGHDKSHILRVVRNALWFSAHGVTQNGYTYKGDVDIVIPAALLHDLVNVPKDSPDRSKASLLSADKAITLLEERIPFKSDMHHVNIHHAIQAHSYSANIETKSVEAMAVQDADRLDSLGYIGLARLFSVGGSMGRDLFHAEDPAARNRPLDEYKYTLDHFYTKLIHLPDTMKTELGRKMANLKVGHMLKFVDQLKLEIEGSVYFSTLS